MVKHGKKYIEASKKVNPATAYQPQEAVGLVKKVAPAKFDETVEVHFRLGVDPRNADQMLRGTMMLPHGTGKEMWIVVFAPSPAPPPPRIC